MIGTGSSRLIDGSSVRIPRIGVYTNKGVNMEKQGVAPDVAVEVTPDDWFRGIDAQLLKAVDVVASDVKEWKRAKAASNSPNTGVSTQTPPPARRKPRSRRCRTSRPGTDPERARSPTRAARRPWG